MKGCRAIRLQDTLSIMQTKGSLETVGVRRLEAFEEQRAAAELYRSVFGYSDRAFAVSPRLMRGLLDNGGTALGAFDDSGEIVGFCYGFTAIEDGRLFHYSQATVVAPHAQGAGLGRLLKHAQAAEAREVGVGAMRWTFDPRSIRNAGFNLNALGARGIRFLSRYYGEPGTDRILVEWPLDLDSSAANRSASAELADLVNEPAALASRGLRLCSASADPTEVAGLFAQGLIALACVRTGCDTAVYVFGRA
jgi:predicted GNAT superfamily acetyltransferase